MAATKYLILEKLHSALKEAKVELFGTVYGLEGADGPTTLVTCVLSGNTLPHDAALLLPPPLRPVAHLTTLQQPTTQTLPLMLRVADGEVQLLEMPSGQWTSVAYSIVSQQEFENSVVVCRISFSLDLYFFDSSAAEAIKSTTDLLNESSVFLMKDSDLVLRDGEVLSLGSCFSNSDEIIGKTLADTSSKGIYKPVDSLKFELLCNRSSDGEITAPIIKTVSQTEVNNKITIKGESLACVPRSLQVCTVGSHLKSSVLNKLELTRYWLKDYVANKNNAVLQAYNVLPHRSGHLFSLIYPENVTDEELVDYRKQVNEAVLLPINCQFMAKNNAFEFADEKTAYHLYNTHIGLKPPSSCGLTSITKGLYSYHHYMQDKFNDNKWGCAYRSLQTIVSWFKHQGHTTKPVPTHKQIQQCLVSIGDKQSKFIDSREWIGSTEVGFVLESYLGVKSRFISVSSGDDLGEKGRELLHHFSTQGTPIMIGGGVLAHTILGVNWDPETGDINYLILDPHYTGGEDITIIQKQGWCGWKGPKFWNSKAYYNLCLPLRPNTP